MNHLHKLCEICGFAAALTKLKTLVLTSNRLSNLVDADLQVALVNLQNLCLLDNIVTKRTNYREHLIQKLPKLRLLHFEKVKLKVHTMHQFSSSLFCIVVASFQSCIETLALFLSIHFVEGNEKISSFDWSHLLCGMQGFLPVEFNFSTGE